MSDGPASTDSSIPADCPCGGLRAVEYGSQKGGWENHDTHLPSVWQSLEVVRDFRPHESRALKLLRCPGCGSWFLYRTDYEYLAGGSEDEQWLFRLDDARARAGLEGDLEGLTGGLPER